MIWGPTARETEGKLLTAGNGHPRDHPSLLLLLFSKSHFHLLVFPFFYGLYNLVLF
ncbi:hypothetical protein AtEden1_Chr5g0090881 [Arabidopsis thaliana]